MLRGLSLRGPLLLLSVAVFAGWTASAPAQIPDTFTNLQVLPKDIAKGKLVETMRGFASGLGVRCHHCHVGKPDGSLEGMNFASDDKKEKKIARAMMAMVKEINGALIPKTGIENPVQVKCVTCHHGVHRPESIEDITKREFSEAGLDSAKANYLSLKEKYYGKDSYNFTSGPLNAVAEWLAEEKKDPDAAVAIMKFNIEQYPDIAYSYNLLGRIQAGAGKKDEAIASLTKAIELDPEDKWSARILEKLKAEK